MKYKMRSLLDRYGMADDLEFRFGTDNDVSVGWDGTNSVVEVLPKTDDTGAWNFGDGTTDLDVKVFLGTTSAYAEFDVGNGRLNIEGAEIHFGDDDVLEFGDGSDAQILFSTGDASNHALVVALDNTSQQVHITDVGAKATDWNVSAATHPELYIHSNTTPATDYLRIGGHDGTTAYVDNVGGTTTAFQIAGATELDLTATVLNLADGNQFFVGVEATPASNAGINWIGIEDGADDPSGTLANALAIYTPDGGDSLDFLHADGTTDSLGT